MTDPLPFGAVTVIGMGYIGLPTAVVLATRGIRVTGIDIKPETIELVNAGRVPFVEPELQTALSGVMAMGHLRAQTDVAPADAFIIAVPTPFGEGWQPDLSHVQAASASIAPILRPGNLLILESTSPPGTTEWISRQIAAARPDLRLPHVDTENADIAIAHCPERVRPGRTMIELVLNDRVIGGISPTCGTRAAELYQLFCEGDCLVTDATTAELVKLVENSYRDVNIAFANEVAAIAKRLGVDGREVIHLANRHPRVDILSPGPGVGGHCIAVDPWFIVASAPEEAKLIRTAREVNDEKPRVVVDEVMAIANDLEEPTIACLGLAFKPNVDDLRQSPAADITRALATANVGRILAVEPHIDSLPPPLLGAGVELTSFDHAVSQADIIVVLVGHDAFGTSAIEDRGAVVLDTCGAWESANT